MKNNSEHNQDQDTSPPLPSYLARHVRLGFDCDDVAALISSIHGSQVPESQSLCSLPHLPAEILLHILDYVPIDYILDWRRVCHGFRDAIDGRVLHDYLKRTELIGYIGPRESLPQHLTVEDYEAIHLLRLSFRELHDDTKSNVIPSKYTDKNTKGPGWTSKYATFDNRDGWSQRHERVVSSTTDLRVWIESSLDPRGVMVHYGALNWCMKLDSAVLDVEQIWQRTLDVNVPTATVCFSWKDLLFSFLKTETMIRKLMEEKRNSTFTFGLLEDCLRAVRRQRLLSALDQQIKEDRRLAWAMGLLRPLFGKPRYDKASAPWDGLERAEDDALRMLMMLRREASMSTHEPAQLKQLARDRTIMATELESINTTFSSWTKNLYGSTTQHIQVIRQDLDVELPAANPLFWDEQTIIAVGYKVGKWRTQRKTIEQVMMLLRASNEALEVPEDAFDDLGSQLEDSE